MVLMLSLERTNLYGKKLFAAFYLRRFFRLYPLSMFCVTCAMLLHRSPEITNPVRHWKQSEYLSNMALTTNLTYSDNMIGGLWTLPLEVQMYLALPLLFLIGR
jgi:peptidoglycan/LPS O-acetylase OafA/YrhL